MDGHARLTSLAEVLEVALDFEVWRNPWVLLNGVRIHSLLREFVDIIHYERCVQCKATNKLVLKAALVQ